MLPVPTSLRDGLAGALLLLLAGCTGAGAGAARVASPPPAAAEAPAPTATVRLSSDRTPIGRELSLATFDSVWSHIRRTYYDSTFRGLDWPGVRDELRPRAEQATTLGELRSAIDEMLERIGESHFGLIRREASAQLAGMDSSSGGPPEMGGDVGVWTRLADDRVLITWVEPGSPADAAGIRMGWSVDSVDAFATAPLLAAHASLADSAAIRLSRTRIAAAVEDRFLGAPGQPVAVVLRDAEDRVVRRTVVRRTDPGELYQFPQLPARVVRVRHERLAQADGGCVGLVHFNSWMLPAARALDGAMDAVRDCRGVVLDLRGNRGGVISMMGAVGGHFFDEPRVLGSLFGRGTELRVRAAPRFAASDGTPARPYAGPLAVLVDALTASNSEFFTAALQQTGRARAFGQPSAGQAVPATTIRLPTDDVLLFVMSNYGTPDGSRLEGSGVRPDVLVPLRRADLLAGRDAPLEAAVGWLRSAAAPSP